MADIKTVVRRSACDNIDKIIQRYSDGKKSSAVDLLVDLRHWCDKEGIDFGEAAVTAQKIYQKERE